MTCLPVRSHQTSRLGRLTIASSLDSTVAMGILSLLGLFHARHAFLAKPDVKRCQWCWPLGDPPEEEEFHDVSWSPGEDCFVASVSQTGREGLPQL